MNIFAHVHAGAGATADTRVATAVLVLHVVAAATWIAGVVVLVLRRTSVRRVAPMLTVAAITTVATGVVNTRIHIEAPELLTHRAYGWVFIAKLALVAVAGALARVVRRSGRLLLLRLEALALMLAAAAGVALALLPGLTSALPGLSIVASVTSDPECLSQIDGAYAAARELRPTSTLTFITDGQTSPPGALRVPDCSSPADDDLSATATWLTTTLARHGTEHVSVVVDQDVRGHELAAQLGASTIAVGAAPSNATDTIIVATGWSHADAALQEARAPLRRVVLAPWLLRRSLLAPAVTDARDGQVAVVTLLDPTGITGVAYVQALARLDTTLDPSAAGLLGYTQMRGLLRLDVQTTGRPKLFTPANIAFLPPDLDAGHAHTATSGWLPQGDLAPLT